MCLQNSVSLGNSQVRSYDRRGKTRNTLLGYQEKQTNLGFKSHSRKWNLLILDCSKEYSLLHSVHWGWRDGGYEHWLLFPKSQVQFPIVTWRLPRVCNTGSKESMGTAHMGYTYIQRYIHIKINE